MWCRRLTFCDINRILFSSSGVRRQIFRTRVSMVTGGDVVERLEKRAVEAEETISLLKSQLLFLQKAAGLWRKQQQGCSQNFEQFELINEYGKIFLQPHTFITYAAISHKYLIWIEWKHVCIINYVWPVWKFYRGWGIWEPESSWDNFLVHMQRYNLVYHKQLN